MYYEHLDCHYRCRSINVLWRKSPILNSVTVFSMLTKALTGNQEIQVIARYRKFINFNGSPKKNRRSDIV